MRGAFSIRSLLAVLAVAACTAAAWLQADARSWSLIANTLKLVAGTLAIGLPLGIVLGVALFRCDLPLRSAAVALLASLTVMPLYLQATGWQAGFGMSGWYTLLTAGPYQYGVLEGWSGAIWVHGLAAAAWVALVVGVAARFVEPELEEAALLDASPLAVLWRVTLRHAAPAIGLAALWIAISVATDMTVTDLFQVGPARLRTYAEEVYTQLALLAEPDQTPPAALVGVALTGALAIAAVCLAMAAANWRPQWTARRPLVYHLGRLRLPLGAATFAIALLMIVVPLVNLVIKAGIVVTKIDSGYLRDWTFARFWQILSTTPVRYSREIGWSLLCAVLAATLVLLIATPLCWLARRIRFVATAALLMTIAALAVPGPLVGGFLIRAFNDPASPWLNFLYDRTIFVVVLAQAIRALPLGMLIVWHALRTIPQPLLDTAAVDGAGEVRQFFFVALPLRWPSLVLAWLVSVVVAIGELSATILVCPPGVMTLGVRTAQLLHFNVQNELAGLSLTQMLATLAITVAAAWIVHRRSAMPRGES